MKQLIERQIGRIESELRKLDKTYYFHFITVYFDFSFIYY